MSTTHTCTIVTTGTGGRCGQPAVVTYASTNGVDTLGVCSDHVTPGDFAALGTPTLTIAPGDLVDILHAGVMKTGTVVAVRRSRCDVKVSTYGGRDSRIVRNVAINDLAPLS